MNNSDIRALQAPLIAGYRDNPETAVVVDCAATNGHDPGDPFHLHVEPMRGSGVSIPVSVHAALGGPHDAPTPGDLLCAALAACAESSLRMVAGAMGVELEHLAVSVEGDVDVRGTLRVAEVAVGFQSFRVRISLRAAQGTPAHLQQALVRAAEASCVVLQTLRSPPPVDVDIALSESEAA